MFIIIAILAALGIAEIVSHKYLTAMESRS
jgi:hypothetical protein